MQILTILRHAKSSWDLPGISDIDRTLKPRGIQNSGLMAQKIKKLGPLPDLILSSPAIRALHTTTLFMRELSIPFKNLIVVESLYITSEDEVLKLIRNTPDTVKHLMIVGHNPTLTDLLALIGNNPPGNLSTCGMGRLEFKSESWEKVSRKFLVSEYYDQPEKK